MSRVEKTLSIVIVSLLALLAIVYLGWNTIPASSPDTVQAVTAPPATPKPTIDHSPKLQSDRKALIEKMIQLDVFTKVVQNGNAMPRAWVGRTFPEMPFDEKVKALTLVYAYYFDGSNRTASVAIIDGRTGKEIGRFDQAGLRLD